MNIARVARNRKQIESVPSGRRAGSMQCLAQCLEFHESTRGRDRGVGLTHFEAELLLESLDDHVDANVLAQKLSRRDEGLEVVDHV